MPRKHRLGVRRGILVVVCRVRDEFLELGPGQLRLKPRGSAVKPHTDVSMRLMELIFLRIEERNPRYRCLTLSTASSSSFSSR